jgi:hypothetical protein
LDVVDAVSTQLQGTTFVLLLSCIAQAIVIERVARRVSMLVNDTITADYMNDRLPWAFGALTRFGGFYRRGTGVEPATARVSVWCSTTELTTRADQPSSQSKSRNTDSQSSEAAISAAGPGWITLA